MDIYHVKPRNLGIFDTDVIFLCGITWRGYKDMPVTERLKQQWGGFYGDEEINCDVCIFTQLKGKQ